MNPRSEQPTRAAIVAVFGRPNVGKSSLLNRLVGEHLSAVSPRPQTTWRNQRGIWTDERGQLVFVDTPGLHEAVSRMNAAMVQAACEGLAGADLRLAVFEAGRLGTRDRRVAELAAAVGPWLAVLNKTDLVDAGQLAADLATLQDWGATETIPASALRGDGLEELRNRLFALAPEGDLLYPDDELSDRPVRDLVAEYVREALFHGLQQEIPYQVLVEVEEFREGSDPLYIRIVLHVERDSQKRILIGEGGRSIREIGRYARRLAEQLLGQQVYLDLWVKVLPKWSRREGGLRRAGLTVGGRVDRKVGALVEHWQRENEPDPAEDREDGPFSGETAAGDGDGDPQ